jgi:hypothetical protein
MNNFKNISGAGGIFHIFVPGLFLLLNMAAGIYFSPLGNELMQAHIKEIMRNPTTSVALTIGVGYLIGVVLRIFRSELADRLSARFLRRFDRKARGPETLLNLYAHDEFPYSRWLGELCGRLPPEVKEFYEKSWKGKKSSTFLNFCKVMIISEDERAANEIYAAEALSRYISGMLYALFIAAGVIAAAIISQFIVTGKINLSLLAIDIGYMAAILSILANFRFIRIKEVFTVFVATYKNKGIFPSPTTLESEEKKCSLTTA